MKKKLDILVVGAGHAGCEAALAAARMGYHVGLVTLRPDRIGYMPCNPAIGGLAKGHLVRELDALGGEIGFAADRAGIQFRMLNRTRGPAVWSPRAQCDKRLYSAGMARTIEGHPYIELIVEEVVAPIVNKNGFEGFRFADGSCARARAGVLTTGTFLGGLMHTGQTQTGGGRAGEKPATRLSVALRALGLRSGRLKTGTPPRVYRDSVDLTAAVFEEQRGDEPPTPFSHRSQSIALRQVSCYLTRTTEATHDVIRRNLDRSPIFTGVIEGIGPRYCPSIEDKVVRFPDRSHHQIFVEPEGLDHPELYMNGVSTSLPVDVQAEILATIPGFERAHIARPGYAVEYDFFPPDQLRRTMESKAVSRLYFAGQVNGTSGYEEAAAQGFVAGVNAALALRGADPFVLRRDEAYIGVLVDDLTTKQIGEPYRMFTSRAEFRLLLRQDNADERLMGWGVTLGLVAPRALETVERRLARERALREMLDRSVFPVHVGNEVLVTHGLEPVRRMHATLADVLRRPGVTLTMVCEAAGLAHDEDLDARVESDVKYAGYIKRQKREIARVRALDDREIPADFPWARVHGLSAEARQKLSSVQPETVGQASRIDGVRASDLSIVVVHLGRLARNRARPASPA